MPKTFELRILEMPINMTPVQKRTITDTLGLFNDLANLSATIVIMFMKKRAHKNHKYLSTEVNISIITGQSLNPTPPQPPYEVR